jgi:hypothetical protein
VIAVTGQERPVNRALVIPLLAAIAIKDLTINDLPRSVLVRPGELHLPWISIAKGIPYSETADLVAFGVLVLAFVAALVLASGHFTRIAGAFVLALYAYTFAADQLVYTNNVFLFMTLLALMIVEPAIPSQEAPRWPTTVTKGLVTIIYLVGAVMKIDREWASGYILGEAFAHYHGVYSKVFALHSPAAFQLMALGSLAVEAFMAAGLWLRRTRRIAFAVGMVFHVFIDLLLPVRIFSYVMIASYVVFFDAAELAKILAWWQARRPITRMLIAAGAATGVNFVLANLLGIQGWPARNAMALVFAVVIVAGAWIAWDRGLPSTGDSRSFLPKRARIPLVGALAALELFLVAKPLFGGDNRFGWRMFTEVLMMRVTGEGLRDDGWAPIPVDRRWSSEAPAYHWDSLGEQRAQLRLYAESRLEADPTLRGVRMTIVYERNRIAGTETIEVAR